jgi:hypothetical protein
MLASLIRKMIWKAGEMRFVEWLVNAVTKEEPEEDLPLAPPRVYARPKPKLKQSRQQVPEITDFSVDVGGKIDDGGPGKNVLIRNKYVREDTGTHETLKIVDDSLLETKDEFGEDPYNTGHFDRSKSWSSFRTRK